MNKKFKFGFWLLIAKGLGILYDIVDPPVKLVLEAIRFSYERCDPLLYTVEKTGKKWKVVRHIHHDFE